MRIALIAGASGLVGSACLARLLSDPEYGKVIALVRRSLPPDPKLELRFVDFEQLPDHPAERVDDVFCALGTTIKKAGSQNAFRKVDFTYTKLFFEYAKRSGARRIALVSSVGANASSSNFYLRVKGETEAAVTALGFDSANIFRPSFLMGARAESRLGERIAIPVAKMFGFLMIGSLSRYRPISAGTVGAAMVATAKSGEPGVRIYEFNGIQRIAG